MAGKGTPVIKSSKASAMKTEAFCHIELIDIKRRIWQDGEDLF